MRQRIIKTTDTSTNSSMHSCSFVAANTNEKKTQIRLALKIYREMHDEFGSKLQMKLPQINIILKLHSLVSILEKGVNVSMVQHFETLKSAKKRPSKEAKSVKFRDSPNIKNLVMILRIPLSRTMNQAFTRISLATHRDKSLICMILMQDLANFRNLKKKMLTQSFKRIKQVSRNRQGMKHLFRTLNNKLLKLKMVVLLKVSVKIEDLMLENLNQQSLVSCQKSFSEESLPSGDASYQQSNPLCSHQDSGMGDQQMKIAESVTYYRGSLMQPTHQKEYSLGLGSHQISIEHIQNEYDNDITIKESLAIKFGACSILANIFEKKHILNMFSVFISIQICNKKPIPPTIANVPQEMLISVAPTQQDHHRMPNYSSITSINNFWSNNQRGQLKSESDLSQISESETEVLKPQFKAFQSSNPMMPTIKTDLSGQQPTPKEMKLSIIEQLSREQSGHVTLMTYQTGQTDKTEEDVDLDEEQIKQRLLAMNQINEILRLKLKSYFNQILLSSTQSSFKQSFQKNDLGNYFAAPQKKKTVHQKKLQLLVNKVFKEDHSEAQRSTDATDLLTTINRKGSSIESKEISPEKSVKLIRQVPNSKSEIRSYSVHVIGFVISILLYLTLRLL